MRRGSLLAGLRPRDDESETALDDEEAPDSEPAPKARAGQPSQKGVPKPSPAETRAIDARIFDAVDTLTDRLKRRPTSAEIADAAKVPGATAAGRKQRVFAAMRRRALLTEPAKKPSSGAAAKKVQVPRVSPEAPGVRAVEDLRDRLRAQLAAVEVTLEALRGEP